MLVNASGEILKSRTHTPDTTPEEKLELLVARMKSSFDEAVMKVEHARTHLTRSGREYYGGKMTQARSDYVMTCQIAGVKPELE